MSSVVNESTNGLLAYRREFPILEQRTYLASHSLGACLGVSSSDTGVLRELGKRRDPSLGW